MGQTDLSIFDPLRLTFDPFSQSDEATLHSAAVLQQFTIPSPSNLVGFYSTSQLSHDLRIGQTSPSGTGSPDQSLTSHAQPVLSDDVLSKPCDTMTTSCLGGCVIVTSTCVYQCRQKRSAETLFQELALNPKTLEKAEEFGITFKLDVCGLYKVCLCECECVWCVWVLWGVPYILSIVSQVAAGKKLADGQHGLALKLFELSRVSISTLAVNYLSPCKFKY